MECEIIKMRLNLADGIPIYFFEIYAEKVLELFILSHEVFH